MVLTEWFCNTINFHKFFLSMVWNQVHSHRVLHIKQMQSNNVVSSCPSLWKEIPKEGNCRRAYCAGDFVCYWKSVILIGWILFSWETCAQFIPRWLASSLKMWILNVIITDGKEDGNWNKVQRPRKLIHMCPDDDWIGE